MMRANKRFQPTASLAALASRRLKRGPLARSVRKKIVIKIDVETGKISGG